VCPRSPHICQNEKVSETMLLYNVHTAIIARASEYHGMMTKHQAPFLSETADWGLHMSSTLDILLDTPLHLYPSSK
jgi:hypothetical protein